MQRSRSGPVQKSVTFWAFKGGRHNAGVSTCAKTKHASPFCISSSNCIETEYAKSSAKHYDSAVGQVFIDLQGRPIMH